MERLRLGLCALLLFLPIGPSVVGWFTSQARFGFDAERAPSLVGEHRGIADERLAPDVVEMLEPDSYVMRRYESGDGPPIWLYLAGYSGTGSTGAHDPAVCYPANGWDLSRLDTVRVPLADGSVLTAHLLLAAQRGQEELALYWFQPAGRWPTRTPWEQLLRVYDRFRGRPEYVFVRLSTSLEAGEQRPREELVRFASELAPWLREALEPRDSRVAAR